MKVWQIATGEPGRDYSQLFFDYDVMIIGPSRNGDARSYDYYDGIPNSSGSQVHSFANNPQPGDRVIMRFARKVIGVGEIPQGDRYRYCFEQAFRCVYGWDLEHCRRVIWAKNYPFGALANVFRNTTQKPSFTEVHDRRIVEIVGSIDSTWFQRPIKRMPKIDSSLYTDEELGVQLFQAGISNKNIEDISKALRQAERLCAWYRSENGRHPSENEVVSHIILPLFLGLGWSHQQIAVEWNNVDMGFFKRMPKTGEECVMILEAKGLGQPLNDVLDQPIAYVESLELRRTKYIITTDGANLFVYGRRGKNWNTTPIGYMNVRSLQKENILPKRTNLIDTLVMLQPSSV